MTFEEFKQEVSENIKDYLPKEYEKGEVAINDVIKNNDMHLSGLTIRLEENPLTPTVYLEDFYRQMEEGDFTFSETMEKISTIYDTAMHNDIAKNASDIVENITDYEATKDKILPRVVNKEANEERLKGMPHTEMGDLAVTYHVDLGKENDGAMSVAISNEMMDRYGISVEELHDQACENMENLTPTQVKSMRDTLLEIMVPGYADMSEEERNEAAYQMGFDDMPQDAMYVISNTEKSFGAAALLDSDSLDQIEEKIGKFYILPSSVHECILVPKTAEMDLSALESMVQEVNSTQVAPSEVLSDHVFAYDSETKEIYRADLEAEHVKEKESRMTEEKTEKSEKPVKAKSTGLTDILTENKAEKEEKPERPSLKAKLEEKKKESKELSKEKKEKEIGRNTPEKGGVAL